MSKETLEWYLRKAHKAKIVLRDVSISDADLKILKDNVDTITKNRKRERRNYYMRHPIQTLIAFWHWFIGLFGKKQMKLHGADQFYEIKDAIEKHEVATEAMNKLANINKEISENKKVDPFDTIPIAEKDAVATYTDKTAAFDIDKNGNAIVELGGVKRLEVKDGNTTYYYGIDDMKVEKAVDLAKFMKESGLLGENRRAFRRAVDMCVELDEMTLETLNRVIKEGVEKITIKAKNN